MTKLKHKQKQRREHNEKMARIQILILFLSFRRVLNVMCFFLGNSPASEF